MNYRIFIDHEDPKSYNDGEKIVVNEAVPTLRDVRRLVCILGTQAIEPDICKKACMLAEAVKEGSRRATLAHEKFPITLRYDSNVITLTEADEATYPFDNKWVSNISLLKVMKYLMQKHEKSLQ